MPYKARVFENLPGAPQTDTHGELHHVDLDFTYKFLAAKHDDSIPGKQRRWGGLTESGVSLKRMKKIPYTAVSYVWGSGDLSRAVKLPDHDLYVTATVDTILRRLRDRHSPTYLWID